MTASPASVLRSIARLSARERRLQEARAGSGGPMQGGGDQVATLLDAVAVLDALGAPYALIGGVAVGLHTGQPRATLDVDLAVHTAWRRPELAARLTSAGFELRGEHPHSLNFRHRSGEPLQLAFDASFDPMLARAERFDVDGVSVAVVAREDLIAMKSRAAADPGRRPSKALRDRADVELLRGDVPDADEGW